MTVRIRSAEKNPIAQRPMTPEQASARPTSAFFRHTGFLKRFEYEPSSERFLVAAVAFQVSGSLSLRRMKRARSAGIAPTRYIGRQALVTVPIASRRPKRILSPAALILPTAERA